MRKFLPIILAVCLLVSGCSSSGGSSGQDSLSSDVNSISPSYGITVDGNVESTGTDDAYDTKYPFFVTEVSFNNCTTLLGIGIVLTEHLLLGVIIRTSVFLFGLLCVCIL